MSFELTGKLIEKYNVQQVSDKFRKREFVIEKSENTNGMVFTDYVKFQLSQDRCNLIDNVSLKEEIKVTFNVKGNRWEKDGKVSYFVNLEAWKVEKLQKTQAMPEAPEFNANDIPPEEATDDLPF
jgi:uncharacterized lipoprotein